MRQKAIAAFAIATLALVGCGDAPRKGVAVPYQRGDFFILHVTRVTGEDKFSDSQGRIHEPGWKFEATGHGARLTFECAPGYTCSKLSTTDYMATETLTAEGLLMVGRESDDETRPDCRSCGMSRFYRIVDESR